jgi:1,4-dihydroxy-2-naphthoyl-CoA synthase
VVPISELKEEVRRWADDMLDKSPTALRALKCSLNADSDSIAGIGALSYINLELFVKTDEAKEGLNAFNEKRPPVFSRFR